MSRDRSALAFEELYRQHSRLVVAYLMRRTSPEEARDIAAEVFVVAWRRLDQVPDVAGPWLIATARHLLSNARRSERRRLALVDRVGRSTHRTVGGEGDGVEMDIDIERAMAQMSDSDSELLRLLAWEELSITEAATVLECSPATLRVRLHRARQRLAHLLATNESQDAADATWPTPGESRHE